MEKIESESELFRGMLIEKPPMATVLYDGEGDSIYTCPHCHMISSEDECDGCGAEPNCLFCNHCNGEFERP